jgi:hypothetical protein
MSAGRYVVRKMSREEVPFAIGLAAEEGWNPGLYDAECFYSADPDGFLVGLLDGEPVSSLSVVRYGQTYGFLGLYIVKPAHRGKGLGMGIWKEGMSYLTHRDVGLDGVLAQEDVYKQSGFGSYYHNIRYQGQAAGTGSVPVDARVVELAQVPFEELQTYDESLFRAPRPGFLRSWINQPEAVALGFAENGRLRGYTVLRRCLEGYKIGPLFADGEAIAEVLFQQVTRRVDSGSVIFLDVPAESRNPPATRLARRHGMREVFETARMYRISSGGELNLPLERWFGVTTFELG